MTAGFAGRWPWGFLDPPTQLADGSVFEYHQLDTLHSSRVFLLRRFST